MGGAKPGAADLHAYMNFWWVKAAIPQVAASLLSECPKIDAWCARVAALGHGDSKPMDAKDALAIARASTSTAKETRDARGTFQPQDAVTVSADDYGRDPVAGKVVFANAHEIAIRRDAAEVGEVVVHFPRAGFNVAKA
jgi:glutathione S-transferase